MCLSFYSLFAVLIVTKSLIVFCEVLVINNITFKNCRLIIQKRYLFPIPASKECINVYCCLPLTVLQH
jgi:hypothetical protein